MKIILLLIFPSGTNFHVLPRQIHQPPARISRVVKPLFFVIRATTLAMAAQPINFASVCDDPSPFKRGAQQSYDSISCESSYQVEQYVHQKENITLAIQMYERDDLPRGLGPVWFVDCKVVDRVILGKLPAGTAVWAEVRITLYYATTCIYLAFRVLLCR